MEKPNIVTVQFRTLYGDGYGGIGYNYIADEPLKVGDIVTVPTFHGDGEARVCRVDVPESDLPKWLTVKDLKHITAPKKESEEK